MFADEDADEDEEDEEDGDDAKTVSFDSASLRFGFGFGLDFEAARAAGDLALRSVCVPPCPRAPPLPLLGLLTLL